MDPDLRIGRLPGARAVPMATSAAFLIVTVLLVVAGPGPLPQRSVAALLPALLAVRLGAHARDLDLDEEDDLETVLGWTFGGIAVMAIVALWFSFTTVVLDLRVPPGIASLTVLAAGALLGILVGRYSVQARQQVSATTRARVQRELSRRQRERITLLNRVLGHHTRNAVNVVVVNAETLRPHVGEEGIEYVEAIHERSLELSDTVDVIQDVAETLAEVGQLRERDLVGVLEAQLRSAREAYPDAEFVLEDRPDEATVRADDLLERVVGAQLENAVEHSDRDRPTVRVDLERDGDAVRLRVADDGPGIPDAKKSLVFDAGDRGETTAGDGLDLFLVDAVVERYGGRITVEDNDPRGTVFVTTLPTPEADHPDLDEEPPEVDTNPAMLPG